MSSWVDITGYFSNRRQFDAEQRNNRKPLMESAINRILYEFCEDRPDLAEKIVNVIMVPYRTDRLRIVMRDENCTHEIPYEAGDTVFRLGTGKIVNASETMRRMNHDG